MAQYVPTGEQYVPPAPPPLEGILTGDSDLGAMVRYGAVAFSAYHGYKSSGGKLGHTAGWGVGAALFPIPVAIAALLLGGFVGKK